MNTSQLPPRRLKRRLRLLISMLKGGPGKTTSVWFLAQVFASWGNKVVAVCADLGSRTLSSWYDDARTAGWEVPFQVIVWRGEAQDGPLSTFLKEVEAKHEPDALICDTGGERREVFMSACLWAERLLSPCGPSELEIRQLHETKRYASQVAEYSPLLMSILLTRVPSPGRGLAVEARGLIEEEKPTPANRQQPYALHVMTTEIPNSHHRFSVPYGTVSDDHGAYADLATELADELEEDQ